MAVVVEQLRVVCFACGGESQVHPTVVNDWWASHYQPGISHAHIRYPDRHTEWLPIRNIGFK